MKKSLLFFVILGLVALPVVAAAEMWVGGHIGGNLVADSDVDVSAPGVSGTIRNIGRDAAVIGGLQIGYNFVKEGFLGYNYPDWMKYFSFAIDFTYNRMDIDSQRRPAVVNGVALDINVPKIESYAATLGFLFIGKYGFFPDSQVPFGRLVPYVGVGPAILFSGINAEGNSDSAVDICLLVEGGVKYYPLKNVSLDLAFRYRYAQPEYSATVLGVPVDLKVDALHQFSFLFRANLHF